MALQSDSVVVTGLHPATSRHQLIQHFRTLTEDGNSMRYILHPFLNDATIAVVRFDSKDVIPSMVLHPHVINGTKVKVKMLPPQIYSRCHAVVDPFIVACLPDLTNDAGLLRDLGVSVEANTKTGDIRLTGSLLQLQCAQSVLYTMMQNQVEKQERDLLVFNKNTGIMTPREGPVSSTSRSMSGSLRSTVDLEALHSITARSLDLENIVAKSLNIEHVTRRSLDERLTRSVPSLMTDMNESMNRSYAQQNITATQESPISVSPNIQTSQMVDDFFRQSNNSAQFKQNTINSANSSVDFTMTMGLNNIIEVDTTVFEYLVLKHSDRVLQIEQDCHVKMKYKKDGDTTMILVSPQSEDRTCDIQGGHKLLINLYQTVFFSIMKETIIVDTGTLKKDIFKKVLDQVHQDYKSDLIVKVENVHLSLTGKRFYVASATQYILKMLGGRTSRVGQDRDIHTARDTPERPKMIYMMRSAPVTPQHSSSPPSTTRSAMSSLKSSGKINSLKERSGLTITGTPVKKMSRSNSLTHSGGLNKSGSLRSSGSLRGSMESLKSSGTLRNSMQSPRNSASLKNTGKLSKSGSLKAGELSKSGSLRNSRDLSRSSTPRRSGSLDNMHKVKPPTGDLENSKTKARSAKQRTQVSRATSVWSSNGIKDTNLAGPEVFYDSLEPKSMINIAKAISAASGNQDTAANLVGHHGNQVTRKSTDQQGLASQLTSELQHMEFETPGGIKVSVYTGNIAQEEVDVIINPVRDDLHLLTGVSAAISEAAGSELQRECTAYVLNNGNLKVGACMHTEATGLLKCYYVLHVVGPMWALYENKQECRKVLIDTFLHCLEYSQNILKAKYIALPAISSGMFGVPLEVCSQAAYIALQQFDARNGWQPSLNEIHFVHSDLQDTAVMSLVFKRLLEGATSVTQSLDLLSGSFLEKGSAMQSQNGSPQESQEFDPHAQSGLGQETMAATGASFTVVHQFDSPIHTSRSDATYELPQGGSAEGFDTLVSQQVARWAVPMQSTLMDSEEFSQTPRRPVTRQDVETWNDFFVEANARDAASAPPIVQAYQETLQHSDSQDMNGGNNESSSEEDDNDNEHTARSTHDLTSRSKSQRLGDKSSRSNRDEILTPKSDNNPWSITDNDLTSRSNQGQKSEGDVTARSNNDEDLTSRSNNPWSNTDGEFTSRSNKSQRSDGDLSSRSNHDAIDSARSNKSHKVKSSRSDRDKSPDSARSHKSHRSHRTSTPDSTRSHRSHKSHRDVPSPDVTRMGNGRIAATLWSTDDFDTPHDDMTFRGSRSKGHQGQSSALPKVTPKSSVDIHDFTNNFEHSNEHENFEDEGRTSPELVEASHFDESVHKNNQDNDNSWSDVPESPAPSTGKPSEQAPSHQSTFDLEDNEEGESQKSVTKTLKQPITGRMLFEVNRKIRLAGFDDVGTVVIKYNFPSGKIQGVRYESADFEAYLPYTPEGRDILTGLRKAFEDQQTFVIEAAGDRGLLTWARVEHKTSLAENEPEGYPDDNYITRIRHWLVENGYA